jgi:hypothetical protein
MSHQELLAIIAKGNQMVEFELIDEDGTGNDFETDQAITDTPTLTITCSDPTCSRFLMTEVMYYMNPTAAETYEMYLLEEANADDVISLSKIVFDSEDARVDSQVYIAAPGQGKLPKIVDLTVPGLLYYLMAWTGAPGNTPGFIKVRGFKVA